MITISIIGCGWFGLPLAKELLARGYRVKGSKRNPEGVTQLRRQGILASRLDLAYPELLTDCPELFDTDNILINIPPSRGQDPGSDPYLAQLKTLQQRLSERNYRRLIFISSTGVYAPGTRLDEGSPLSDSPGAHRLIQAEQLFAALPNACIVRFAGLMGPERHPGRFLSGKKSLPSGQNSVNMLHLDDAIGGVCALLEYSKPLPGNCYNLCPPHHPTREAFYTRASQLLGVPLPKFAAQGSKDQDRVIDGSRICRELNYRYQIRDPLQALPDLTVAAP
ncbi:SDR family oxidoreductase [Dongshaea marina]|uniref:SDR family oxidoreductase n=1 Tax=Dongshaea marina TaxID=2047966 RepID=UPI000D3EB05B|nr:SDR family oxidoreductase [Dongshaea marina]